MRKAREIKADLQTKQAEPKPIPRHGGVGKSRRANADETSGWPAHPRCLRRSGQKGL